MQSSDRFDAEDDAIGRIADRAVWKPLHGVVSSHQHPSDRWTDFEEVNERLARATEEVCDLGDTVWIHDYPFLLGPRAIRSARPDLRIGFSLHTPFDANTMGDHVHAFEIAASLEACDLIGVQTIADVDQLEMFLAGAGVFDPPGIVVSPTSIDPARTLAAADRAVTSPQLRDLQQRAGSRQLIVSVDDLQHTSAIGERLVAFDLAFRQGILHSNDVLIVQIVNTRHRNSADDQALRVELERVAHTLNSIWIGPDRTPIVEIHFDSVDADVTLAIMRLADIFMYTPTCAGMGVVAKEVAVLTESTPSALILSDRCGAAAELGPYSVLVDGAVPDSIVEGLQRAGTLDVTHRIGHAALRSLAVERWTSTNWAEAFLDDLDRASTARPRSATRIDRGAVRRALPQTTPTPSTMPPGRDDGALLPAPPGSLLTSYFGYACDPHRPNRRDSAAQLPTHRNCAGWWPLDTDPDGYTGWRCACHCHEDQLGWRAYDTHRRLAVQQHNQPLR